MKKIFMLFNLTLILFVISACSNSNSSMSGHDMSNMDMGKTENSSSTNNSESKDDANLPLTTAIKELTGNTINLTAKEAVNQFDSKHKFTVWTFNGSVPGSFIRVKQDEQITINLKNELPEPVTIHWHGLPVPNSQDGIPGVTQNAVQPGKTFTYQFTATVPGTYWYHSHQNGVNQLDKGLYGAFIVEGNVEEKVDKDYTLVLDDWISSGETMDEMDGMSGMDMNEDSDKNNSSSHDMSGMDMGGMNMGDDMSMYDLYTINGKAGSSIEPLKVSKGDKVRIRLINAGYISHKLHLHGHDFKVISTDGNPVNNPSVVNNELISVAPGERYDIEFTANTPGDWYLESHDSDQTATKSMVTRIQYDETNKTTDKRNYKDSLPIFDATKYGENSKASFSINQKYNVEYTMDLNTEMNNKGMVYTINGKAFPETENINVKKGDLVKVTLKNSSKNADHPMHLHGHTFQVLSKNGKPLSGSPILKDTLNLKPGDEYEVAFKADNPGDWMFHCHDLHHASAGMVTELKYDGFTPSFKADPNAGNKPE
ncbi:FtsP/CotA-like multicopper oxidase with cupredoxin domain [Bacillus sp. SLBN-46]|uniref:multicopper oxidase family protein n=1 Tax=Bacillus sp. SLBN-46 TaxID=3042283 RepID=UPI0028591891|nr:multicopper oxidase family protein [Bacillus sp. SLBN-46]MDR6121657.1 FtsP/CotA-like multicopper oxidase with cupredoxin domain [Bacillus sp. SLBN-46]